MREIKFRAWETISKSIVTWNELLPELSRILAQPEQENVILMQYTGIKDKNGKEIYEGDIIMIHATDFSHAFPETIDDIFKAHTLVGESTTHWEVIGNIYENPELIK